MYHYFVMLGGESAVSLAPCRLACSMSSCYVQPTNIARFSRRQVRTEGRCTLPRMQPVLLKLLKLRLIYLDGNCNLNRRKAYVFREELTRLP